MRSRRACFVFVTLGLAGACRQEAADSGLGEDASGGASSTRGASGTATAGTGSAASAASSGPGTNGTSGGATTVGGTQGPKFDIAVDGGVVPPLEATCAQAEAARSNAGCLFAPVVGNQNFSRPWGLAVGNVAPEPAQVTLTAADGSLLDGATIDPGGIVVFVLKENSPELLAHQTSVETMVATQAMRLESDVPVVAYQFTPYSDSQVASSDASLLLPVHGWDDDYRVVNYANNGLPWLLAVSLEDGIQVTVQAPPQFQGPTDAGPQIPAIWGGQSFTVTLNAQQALRVTTAMVSPDADLTGFRVQATGPVAVFAGSPSISIPGPGMNFYKDYLEEQLPPVASWGTRYVAVKFRERGGETDVYRVVAAEDGTVVYTAGALIDTLVLDAGEFAQVEAKGAFTAWSDKPFMVGHFLTSQDQTLGPKDEAAFPGQGQSGNCIAGNGNTTLLGDPALSYLVPTDQFRQRYVFLVPQTYAWDSISVVAPEGTWGQIRLDGVPLPPAAGTVQGFEYGSFAVSDGFHEIAGPAGFGVEGYGYDCSIAYAYPGGASLFPINPAG